MTTAPKRHFRADIQGLRALAVGAVILDHAFHFPSGGFVGVDVFFVISGFLITSLLLREYDRTGTISFSGFYKRRVKRILPVATAAIVVTVIAAWFLFNRFRFGTVLWDGIWAALFTANWHFAAVGTDYFQAEAAVSPLQHYWSLAVEEQFYFVWPWLMLGVFALAAAVKKAGTRNGLRAAGAVMAAISLASFVFAMWETANNPTWAYFSTLSRAWELGIGALIAIFASAFTRLAPWVRTILAWAGLAGIVASLFVVNESAAFPAPWALLPVLSTAAVIVSGTGGTQPPLWPLTNRAATYGGNISFSLYVWHWPIIVFGTHVWGDSNRVLAVLVVVTFIVSVYSYHLLEEPVRRSAWLEPKRPNRERHRPHPLLVGSFTVVLIAGVTSAAVLRPAPDSGSPAPTVTEATRDYPPQMAELQADIREAVEASAYPDDLTPTIDEAMANPQAPKDVRACGNTGDLVDKDACTWGADAPTHTAAIVGDSVSMTWVNPLRNSLPDGWALTSLGTFACPFTDFGTPTEHGDCIDRKADAVDYVNTEHPDLLFIANSYWPGGLNGSDEPPTGDEWKANLEQVLAKIDLTQTRVVFLAAPPSPKNPNSCYVPSGTPADCLGKVPGKWKSQGEAEAALAESHDGQWVATDELFCAGGYCPVFVDTTPVRRDLTHMTVEYGDRITPALRELLDESSVWDTAAG